MKARTERGRKRTTKTYRVLKSKREREGDRKFFYQKLSRGLNRVTARNKETKKIKASKRKE